MNPCTWFAAEHGRWERVAETKSHQGEPVCHPCARWLSDTILSCQGGGWSLPHDFVKWARRYRREAA